MVYITIIEMYLELLFFSGLSMIALHLYTRKETEDKGTQTEFEIILVESGTQTEPINEEEELRHSIGEGWFY